MKRLIVGISGASGAIYGVRLLQVLRDVTDIETHLVMSQAGRQPLSFERSFSLRKARLQLLSPRWRPHFSPPSLPFLSNPGGGDFPLLKKTPSRLVPV
ncbi:hypothetical protein KCA24_33900, partial [Escherichia coli]|nr:hypothetical protein [Escherichia coli]